MKRSVYRISVETGLRLFLLGLFVWLGNTSGYPIAGAMLGVIVAKYLPALFSRRAVGGFLFDAPPTPEATEKALLDKIKTQNDTQLAAFKGEIQALVSQAKTGQISEDKFKEEMGKLSSKLEAFDPEKYKEFTSKIATLEDALKTQGEEMKKIQENGGTQMKGNPWRNEIKKILDTPEWKEFVASGGKKKCEFKLDKAVSVGSNYTGSSRVHITTRDGRVVDHPTPVRLNIRDLLTVSPTDLPYLAFTEVYDWVRGVRMHSENESLAESSFKVREATTDVKRLGTSLELSKRMLKSVAWIESHIATMLPAQARYFEDFQLLLGDGTGNNLTGIFKVADDFSTIINTPITGIAGDVDAVASYDGGTKAIITFGVDKNINNGDKITFAAATAGVYNNTFTAYVIGPKQIAIDVAYVAEANTDAWTFTVASRFKNAIYAAQQIDVLKVAKTLVSRQQYSCTGFVLHPDDATMIETLKGNDEHYLDVERLENGVLRIAGVPVVETTAMPSGKFALGDWAMAAALLEFTSLTLEFSESTQEKLKNTVVAIIHEEVLFPIYNKYMFIKGDFTTAIAAILKVS